MGKKICAVCTLKKAVEELGKIVNALALPSLKVEKTFTFKPVSTNHRKVGKFYVCLVCNAVTEEKHDIEVELTAEDKELIH